MKTRFITDSADYLLHDPYTVSGLGHRECLRCDSYEVRLRDRFVVVAEGGDFPLRDAVLIEAVHGQMELAAA